MAAQTETVQTKKGLVKDPPIAKWLFNSTQSAPLWLVVRVWLGLQWLAAGLSHTMWWDFGNGGYIANGGRSLKGFWDKALTVAPGGQGAAITYDWYYDFLKILRDGSHYEWFAWLITFGEIAVGLGLIFGGLTAVAAFFGTLMNMSFELAGTTSTNPVLFATTIFIILAWKNSGWWGLDRFILPLFGTPWQTGKVFHRTAKQVDDDNVTPAPPAGTVLN